MLIGGIAVTAALLLLLAAAVAWTWVRVVRTGRAEHDLEGAEAIVVLGAQAFPDRPSPELQARLDHAARLWREGVAGRIVCSGGWDGVICEPIVMARALVMAGVPGSAVEIDDRGTCTRETVHLAQDYARSGAHQVVLVSSPYHLYRLSMEARRIGLAASVSAPCVTPIMRRRRPLARQRAREVFAVWRDIARPVPRPRRRGASLAPLADPALAGVQAWRG
jgi:uncharacterized SAM-binding protein YcdF (DUF218 family)